MALSWRSSALVAGLVLSLPGEALAGMPECGDVRVDADADCEVELGDACGSSCGQPVYTQVCSTQQYDRCRSSCTIPPDPACTEACTASCDERCAAGIEIVCHDNCFPECTTACTALCDTAVDTIQCRAACEATCDGECDHQCSMLPDDATCVTHCIECCGGSCVAAANMGCQLDCQTQTWAQCETEVRGGCEAACEDEGALFCDGQLVASGSEAMACADALTRQGIAVDAEGDVHAFDPPLGCGCRREPGGHPWASLGLLGLLGLRGRRRRALTGPWPQSRTDPARGSAAPMY